jgi:hypothetical protein
MTNARKMLMETLAGHLALLQTNYPRKAASPVAKRVKQCVNYSLRIHSDAAPRRQAA